MLNFNHRGFLVPNTNIPSSVSELKSVFVDQISDPKRTGLFDNYVRYSTDLKTVIATGGLHQWIDGSFVTRKQEPGDIDMVTFIDGTVIEQLGPKLDPFKYPASLDSYGVDAYLVSVFEREDSRYPLFVGDRMYWMDAFDKTRRTRNGQKLPKGFLEIIY